MQVLLCGTPLPVVGCGVLELNSIESRQTSILRLASGRVGPYWCPRAPKQRPEVAILIHCPSQP